MYWIIVDYRLAGNNKYKLIKSIINYNLKSVSPLKNL